MASDFCSHINYLLLLNILLDTMPWCPTWRHWCCESNNRVCLLCSNWELGGWCNIQAWVYSVRFSISNKLIKIGFISIFKKENNFDISGQSPFVVIEANKGIVLCITAYNYAPILCRFKSSSASSSISKGAPDFCTVFVISKGKVSSVRNATRPAAHTSPLLSHIHDLISQVQTQPAEISSRRMNLRGSFLWYICFSACCTVHFHPLR